MKKDVVHALKTGIGLQDVDNLKNSQYFIDETNRYIKGEISFNELDNLITTYYESKPKVEPRSEEADKISIRIANLLSDDSFTFSVEQLLIIHKTLFNGLLDSAGKIREYNFKKKEWVLNGDTVIYADYRDLEKILIYDFNVEYSFSYANLTEDEIINHLANFISNLWQIHLFEEGNTRTAAVFFIKYLRTLGYKVTNNTFANNSWYFRNALVRANYTNITKKIYEDKTFIKLFLRKLLLNENHNLKNRDLHVDVQTFQNNSAKSITEKILNLIECNPNITTNDLSKELNVSLRTIKTQLKRLQNDNLIKRINGKRFGYWKIQKK